MREILFRGKCIDNGEWVYGCLDLDPDLKRASICGFDYYTDPEDGPQRAEFCVPVIPETVGQYTGLTDKNNNGKKIFEGDIVKFGNIIGIINYSNGCYCVKTNKPDWRNRNNPAIDIVINEYPNEIEIIGNIHDNPELLEGGME